ncbi:MAG TPA: sigma-70 family RNA polymerase sigma factor [Firmicutes bacterium]|nr:sigma-70 family RNA polymerase sigma factor [Bacillota bacterium]
MPEEQSAALSALKGESILHQLAVEDYLPENYVLGNEQREQISRVLDGLNPIFKNLLVLRYAVGLSYQEIAEALDINEQTVKTYLYRAKQKFRAIWRGLDDE